MIYIYYIRSMYVHRKITEETTVYGVNELMYVYDLDVCTVRIYTNIITHYSHLLSAIYVCVDRVCLAGTLYLTGTC